MVFPDQVMEVISHDPWSRQAAKLRDPFRRRFTAAWCYAEALHHAVTNSPAVGQFLRDPNGLAPYSDMMRHTTEIDIMILMVCEGLTVSS